MDCSRSETVPLSDQGAMDLLSISESIQGGPCVGYLSSYPPAFHRIESCWREAKKFAQRPFVCTPSHLFPSSDLRNFMGVYATSKFISILVISARFTII